MTHFVYDPFLIENDGEPLLALREVQIAKVHNLQRVATLGSGYFAACPLQKLSIFPVRLYSSDRNSFFRVF